MGTISVTLPADGETMDASDVNNPINTIVTAINGNLDSNNISAGGITPANLVTGTGTSWAWQSWTPTWTNLTIGNATQTAKYIQIGKTIHFYIDIVLGSTSSVSSNADFTVPVTAVSRDGTATTQPYGIARYFDTSASASVLGYCFFKTTATATPQHATVSGSLLTFAATTSTAPFTWATGDNIHIQGTYEAA